MTMRDSFLKYIVLSLMTLSMHAAVQAAALGDLTVRSRLGEPLDAEIALLAVQSDAEARQLAARLADQQAFERVQLPFPPVVASMQASIVKGASGYVIWLTSGEPVNALSMDFLLELSGAGSRLMRKYTFLLDPPDSELLQASVQAVASSPVAVKPVRLVPPAQGRDREVRDTQKATSYIVQRGDVLSSVAGRLKHEEVSVYQMMVALYRDNPDAFVNADMNRMAVGKTLVVPGVRQVQKMDDGEARTYLMRERKERMRGQ